MKKFIILAKKTVIVLRGVSGAGKSTAARELVRRADEYMSVRVVSADHYFEKSGTYKFDPTKLGEAHAECFNSFIECLRPVGNTEPTDLVIVDNTNTSATEIAPYMLGAAAFGYAAQVVQVLVSSEVAAARNVHGVPLTGVMNQAKNMAQTLPPWWEIVEWEG